MTADAATEHDLDVQKTHPIRRNRFAALDRLSVRIGTPFAAILIVVCVGCVLTLRSTDTIHNANTVVVADQQLLEHAQSAAEVFEAAANDERGVLLFGTAQYAGDFDQE